MSGLRRRIRRAQLGEMQVSGYKGAARLKSLIAALPRESWPTLVRRFIRESYQTGRRDLRGILAKVAR